MRLTLERELKWKNLDEKSILTSRCTILQHSITSLVVYAPTVCKRCKILNFLFIILNLILSNHVLLLLQFSRLTNIYISFILIFILYQKFLSLSKNFCSVLCRWHPNLVILCLRSSWVSPWITARYQVCACASKFRYMLSLYTTWLPFSTYCNPIGITP